MLRTGKQWPNRDQNYNTFLNHFNLNSVIKKLYTIPQLLAQADMVRMAGYNYGNGIFITTTKKEKEKNPHTDMYWEFSYGIYLYPKNHTFHLLQPPTPDTERTNICR